MGGWLGIPLGDPSGIGPEVTLKALAQVPEDDWKYLLIGGDKTISAQVPPFEGYHSGKGRFFIHNPGIPVSENPAPGSREAAEAAMASLDDGVDRCLRGELAGIVTAPVNKEAIINLGRPFTGQTEYISDRAKTSRTAMMLLGCDDRNRWLRVALATTHIPIRRVADALEKEKIATVIELAAQACRDLGLGRAKVGICGLNPHAGEGGKTGMEDLEIVEPAVQLARSRGVDAEGPIPADTLFYYAFKGDYDAVVAMYHDQGLAPLKMIGFDNGINWTLGLPFIRTSPDHGTAYNIAGQNKANASSMLSAINLARLLASRR